MKRFIIIWFGQLVSLTGSQLTSFALAVWVFEETGSTTQFALISVARFLPGIIVSPFAGALADRWNRRWVMIIGDTGAAMATVLLLSLLYFGQLEVWHIYLSVAINSAFGVVQWPAYAATVPLLVSKEQLGRANGFLELANSFSTLISPALAGVLLTVIHLRGILLIDMLTFFTALLSLFIVRIPNVSNSIATQETGNESLFKDIASGWQYLSRRAGLVALIIFYAAINFMLGQVHHVLLTPMILSFTSAQMLGIILSIGSIGWLGGSLVMTIWGGPKRRIYGTFGFALMMGIGTIIIGLQPIPWLIIVGLFIFQFSAPIAYSTGQAILQSKVAFHMQGRVMAFRKMIAQSTMPLGYLIVGPLADQVLEPLLSLGGFLAPNIGLIIGVGPGRGMALQFILMGLLTAVITVGGTLYPRLRFVEDELPDATDSS